jgi:hypothetical protein
MKQKRGGQTRVAAQPGSGAWFTRCALGLLVAASLGSCLVTQEAEYDAPDSPPRISRARPSSDIVRVPFAPDTECEIQKGMAFEVRVADRDREQELFGAVYINDLIESSLTVRVRSKNDGTDERTFDLRCVPLEKLKLSNVRCNRVTLAVSSDPLKLGAGPNGLDLDFDWASITWTVLKSSLDDPQVSATECAPPLVDAGALFGDAGVLPLYKATARGENLGLRP